jgi:hypothetical protein
MKRFALLAGSVACVILSSVPATAQSKPPRTYLVSEIQMRCTRTYSDPRNCDRTAGVVRQRYGDRVTMMQWNSGAGIVRHLNRQGK